jgi:hypothetical protein
MIQALFKTCFHRPRQLGCKDRDFLDRLNPTFICLIATAVHHCLSLWKTGKLSEKNREFGTGESLTTWTRISAEMASLSEPVQQKLVDVWKKAIRKKQRKAGILLADEKDARPHKDQNDCEEEFLAWGGHASDPDGDGDSATAEDAESGIA